MARQNTAKKQLSAPKKTTEKPVKKRGRRPNREGGNGVNRSKLTVSQKHEKILTNAEKVRRIPIIDDVYLWMKQGYPVSEIARLIHSQGFLENMNHKLLVATLAHLAQKALTPAELAAGRMPNHVLKALEKLQKGIQEVDEAGWLYQRQKQILEAGMRDILDILSLPPNWDLIPKKDIPKEEEHLYRSARAIVINAQEAGAPEGMPLSFYLMASDVYTKMLIHVEGLRKLLRTSVDIKLDLGGDLDKQEETSNEARLAEFTRKHFPGKQVVYDVLSDPKSRRRVGNVFTKIVENVRLQEAIEKCGKIPTGEKIEN